MIIILKVDIMLPDPGKLKPSSATILIPSGTKVSTINPNYVPQDTKVYPFNSQLYGITKLDKEYFIFYYRGMFVAVRKEDCEIPKSIDWAYNL